MSFNEKNIPSAIEEYAEGSILYLRMQNFLTYKDAYFYPGSGMNMIIGPNGSGKSAFVAGIVLALGAPQSLLDRSPHLSEFIRHGCNESNLEIVLKGSAFNKKYKICRTIKKTGSSTTSSYLLDGKPTSHKVIDSLIRETLEIQVDNLTQFIPQDKVRSLSLLAPTALLKETERALIGEHFSMHMKLLNDSSYLKKQSNEGNSLKNELYLLREKQKIIEETLSRCEVIRKTHQKLNALQRKRPWIIYDAAREEYLNEVEERNILSQNLMDQETNPSSIIPRINEKLGEIKTDLKALVYSPLPSQNNLARSSEISHKIFKSRTKYIEVYEAEERRKKDILKKKLEIEERNKILHSLPIHQELEDIAKQNGIKDYSEAIALYNDQQKSPLNCLLKPLEEERFAIDKEIQSADVQKRKEERRLANLNEQLLNLSSKLEIKGLALKKLNHDAYKVWMYLQDIEAGIIESPFLDRVVGPLCMCTTFNCDSLGQLPTKYPTEVANRQIENAIGVEKITFIVSSYDDYCTLTNWSNQNGLHSNSCIIRPESIKRAELYLEDRDMGGTSPRWNSPLDKRTLETLGFRLTLLDLLSSDPWVIAYLMDRNLHLLPVSDKANIDDKLVQQWIMSNKEARVKDYMAKDTIVRFKFKYGEVVSTKNFLKTFRNPFLEMETDLIRPISALEAEIATLTFDITTPPPFLEACNKRRSDIVQKINEITLKKTEINERIQEYSGIWESIQRRKRDLLEGDSRVSMLEEVKDEIMQGITELTSHLLEPVPLATTNNLLAFLKEVVKVQLQITQLSQLSSSLDGHLSHEKAKLDGLRRALSEQQQVVDDLKQKATELLHIAEQGGPLDSDDGDGDGDDNNLEKLDSKIAVLNAEIRSFNSAGGAQYPSEQEMAEYEKRKPILCKKEKEHLRIKDDSTKRWNSLRAQRCEWLLRLQNEVASINENFQALCRKIDVVGEISLSSNVAECIDGQSGRVTDVPIEEDDFNAYSLVVLARYRAEDKGALFSLSSGNHSGGERSLTSVLFLMSLQRLSRAPFRLVDEINQGMDADNERAAYALMVQESQDNKGQYFLITPKLLTSLDYPKGMHVHCVFNGAGVPK